MIPPNPEDAMVAAAKRSLAALAFELPLPVYEDVRAKLLPLIRAVESFDERHKLHQQEQRASAERLAQYVKADGSWPNPMED